MQAEESQPFSERLGGVGVFRHPIFSQDRLPEHVGEVRIHASAKCINEIEFLGKGNHLASTGNFGLRTDPIKSWKLEQNETIVGVFGESYDEGNQCRFKNFGLIIRK